MSRNISIIPAKTAFGTLRQNLCQSDYIARKKGLKTFCNNKNKCNNLRLSHSYDTLNQFALGKYTATIDICPNIFPINKSNLVIGQYSKLNLNGVCDIIAGPPCKEVGCDQLCPDIPLVVPSSVPFYATYTIDPNGSLFGKSQCGSLNYTHHMVFDPSVNFVNYNKII